MSDAARQLPLPFDEQSAFSPDDFVAAECNDLACNWLQRPQAWAGGRMVLWGQSGCGKSFLLHLWAQSVGARILKGVELHGLARPPASPVAVDDADLVADEAALLHLLNAAAEAGWPVLLTQRLAPGRMTWRVPDLASRLRASLAVELLAPDEAMLNVMLVRWAAQRQLTLSPQLTNFLLTRLPRTPAALREAIARLDRAALARGRKLSRRLVSEMLEDLAAS